MTVPQAEAALTRKGLKVALYNVYWETPGYGAAVARSEIDDRWNVSGVSPYAPGAVMLMIDGTGPLPPEVVRKMRDEKTASPSITPTP
jgi:hypothetical protein